MSSRRGRISSAVGAQEKGFIDRGWQTGVTSLGTRYYVEDSFWRWIVDPRNPSRWMRIPYYLIDNPYAGGDNPAAGNVGGTAPTRATQTGQAGREVTATAAEGVIAAIYGDVRLGADVVAHAADTYYYNVQYGLGHGELDSLVGVYHTSGTTKNMLVQPGGNPFYHYLVYEFRAGGLNQDPSDIARFANSEQTSALSSFQTFPGFAFVAVRYTYHETIFPGGPKPLFRVRGRKIYDPRLDANLDANGGIPTRNSTTVVYSNNPILVACDYASDNFFGWGLGDANVNWLDARAEATYAEASIGGEPRFAVNGVIRRETDHDANIETILLHCRGRQTIRRGKWTPLVDRPRASTFTFTKNEARPIRGKRFGPSSVPTAGKLHWTNPAKDWQRETLSIESANAKNGVDEFRAAEWTLEWCTSPGQAARLLSYLFSRRRANLDVSFIPVVPDAIEAEVGDRITYVEEMLGLGSGIELVLDRISDDPTGKFLYEVSQYNEAFYSDVTGVVETRPTTQFADPFAALPAPTGMSLSQTVDEPSPGTWVPRVIVSFTPYSGAWYGGTKVEYRVAGGAWREQGGSFHTGPVSIAVLDGAGKLVDVRLSTVNANTQTAGTETISQSITTYNPEPPEMIGAPRRVLDAQSQTIGWWWEKPKYRVFTNYGSAAYTITNFATYPAINLASTNRALISDGSVAADAIVFTQHSDNGNSYGAYLDIDLGSVKVLRELHFYFSATGAQEPIFNVYHSDNGSTWTEHAGGNFDYFGQTIPPVGLGGETPKLFHLNADYYQGAPVGHRWWRIDFRAPANVFGAGTVKAIKEIRWVEYGADYPYVKGYRYKGVSGVWKDIFFTPDVNNYIPAAEFYSQTFNALSGSGSSQFRQYIKTLSPSMAESLPYQVSSDGIMMAANSDGNEQTYLTVRRQDIFSANGTMTSGSAGLSNYADIARFTPGATAAWSLAGLRNGYDGVYVQIVNDSGYTLTILHESATETTAANRFNTGGFNLAIPTGKSQFFYYEEATARWRACMLDWTNLTNRPGAIDRIANISASYGSIDVTGSLNGYAGIHFPAAGRVFMVEPTYQGIWSTAGWQWYFQNGALTVGTVPWGSVTGKPTAITNIGNAGTYGSLRLLSALNGYNGFEFIDEAGNVRYIMLRADQQGYFNGSAWEWRFMSGSLVNGTVPWGSVTSKPTGLDRILLPTSYGSINVTGNTSGYAGIHFADVSTVLMVASDHQGIYKVSTGTWDWYWQNGSLIVGTVPIARVSGGAPLASPAFTGTPTAPTAAAGTNSTQIATTAFVQTAVAGAGGGGPTFLRKTADQLNGVQNSYVQITDLVIPMDANGVYAFEFFLRHVSDNANAAFGVALHQSVALADKTAHHACEIGTGGTDAVQTANDMSTGAGLGTTAGSGSVAMTWLYAMHRITGVVKCGATAGNLSAYYAPTFGAGSITIKANSWVWYKKIG